MVEIHAAEGGDDAKLLVEEQVFNLRAPRGQEWSLSSRSSTSGEG
jgi:hypothetical protein